MCSRPNTTSVWMPWRSHARIIKHGQHFLNNWNIPINLQAGHCKTSAEKVHSWPQWLEKLQTSLQSFNFVKSAWKGCSHTSILSVKFTQSHKWISVSLSFGWQNWNCTFESCQWSFDHNGILVSFSAYSSGSVHGIWHCWPWHTISLFRTQFWFSRSNSCMAQVKSFRQDTNSIYR